MILFQFDKLFSQSLSCFLDSHRNIGHDFRYESEITRVKVRPVGCGIQNRLILVAWCEGALLWWKNRCLSLHLGRPHLRFWKFGTIIQCRRSRASFSQIWFYAQMTNLKLGKITSGRFCELVRGHQIELPVSWSFTPLINHDESGRARAPDCSYQRNSLMPPPHSLIYLFLVSIKAYKEKLKYKYPNILRLSQNWQLLKSS